MHSGSRTGSHSVSCAVLFSTLQVPSDDEDDTISFRSSVDVRVAELVKQVRL